MQAIFVIVFVATLVRAGETHRIKKRSNTCILPPYPEHGTYTVTGNATLKPGDETTSLSLEVTCSAGYSAIKNNVAICSFGEWANTMPKCERDCRLPNHQSVEYHCRNPRLNGSRPCMNTESSGTTVKPRCKSGYYHPGPLPHMTCVDGNWDYETFCLAECGVTDYVTMPTDHNNTIKINKSVPWHATIYKNIQGTYKQICGGSIVTPSTILTAAHCFWDRTSTKIRPSDYTVVVGKTARDRDANEQRFSVSAIKIPPRYRGSLTSYQDDVAVLILNSAIEYSNHVRPVCLDFDIHFERQQLQEGNIGKVAVWPDPADKTGSLQSLELPYIGIEHCISQATPEFKEYLTADKICAGQSNGTIICKGNSGSGLSFPEEERGVTRHYLRGIVSTSHYREEICSPTQFIAFTEILKHEQFIKENIVK